MGDHLLGQCATQYCENPVSKTHVIFCDDCFSVYKLSTNSVRTTVKDNKPSEDSRHKLVLANGSTIYFAANTTRLETYDNDQNILSVYL